MIISILLIILAVASRLFEPMWQFTAILAVAMIAGMYLPRRYAVGVSLLTMIISDCILGFHDTMFFTWGSMVLIAMAGAWLKSRHNVWIIAGGAVLSSLVFFIITNLAAWPTLYPMTLSGLKDCFVMAVPFYRTTVASTVVYSVVLYLMIERYPLLMQWPALSSYRRR